MKIDKEGMRKLKASLANIALFLSIFVVLFPLALPTVSAEYDKTIFVDDDAPPGGDGSENNPFDEIGLAVEDAFGYSGNVRIRVYEGTYLERVTIGSGASWDTLTLEGNSSSNTTIDAQGTGTVITISASWVNVTGFT
jgi:hypothetical protein